MSALHWSDGLRLGLLSNVMGPTDRGAVKLELRGTAEQIHTKGIKQKAARTFTNVIMF